MTGETQPTPSSTRVPVPVSIAVKEGARSRGETVYSPDVVVLGKWKPPEAERAGRETKPLRQRRLDVIFVGFFVINLTFVTYIFDLECLTISDPVHFRYPLWPPRPFVDLVHWYGRHFDPLLMARPAFWRMTMWIDVLFFGPFYVLAIYAFVRGRDWIRLPAVLWAGTMMANVAMIMLEEWHGIYRTNHLAFVAALNVPWFFLPLLVVARVVGSFHPFTVPAGTTVDSKPSGVPLDLATET